MADHLRDVTKKTDFISREAAIEAAKAHYPKANKMIAGIILVPAADVRPVMRGKWIGNGCQTLCRLCGLPVIWRRGAPGVAVRGTRDG